MGGPDDPIWRARVRLYDEEGNYKTVQGDELHMCRIIHFEVQAEDPERASTFYRDVFGWDVQEWVIPGVQIPDENRYWLVNTMIDPMQATVNGGIVLRRGPPPAEGQPVNTFLCTVEVPDLGAFVEKVRASGGRVMEPRMAVRGIGWWARCTDTEGNLFGMLQPDATAS